MNNLLFLTKFSIFLILFTSLLSTSVLAQEKMSQPIIIFTWIIGGPALITGLVSFYYLIKAAKAYGGKLGSSLFKIYAFIVIIVIIILSMGIINGVGRRGFYIDDNYYIIVGILGFISTVFLLWGSRDLSKLAKS